MQHLLPSNCWVARVRPTAPRALEIPANPWRRYPRSGLTTGAPCATQGMGDCRQRLAEISQRAFFVDMLIAGGLPANTWR